MKLLPLFKSLQSAALISACAASLLLSTGAQALSVVSGLFSTGVDSGGVSLPGTTYDGSHNVTSLSNEIHWTLTSTPGGYEVGGGSLTPRVLTSASGYPIPPWLGDSAQSAWIAPTPIGNTTNNQLGSWTYNTSFNISGLVSGLSIGGRWAVDNSSANILVNFNNQNQFITTGDAFTAWHSFVLTSGFLEGTNNLEIIVTNSGGPTGLRVEIPEPATLALVGLALIGGFGVSRKRKQA